MPHCNEEGCTIVETGVCINNLDIATCPHYSETDVEVEVQLTDLTDEYLETTDNETGDVIEVFSGKAMTLLEANEHAAKALSRLVILAGLPDSGKTTLLLSLMHLFQTKPAFENHYFAGSATLLDFEEKSHPSKIASFKAKADTSRTPLGPPTFLHLRISNEISTANKVDLLFTDVSGEQFIALRDSGIDAANFTMCQRADHFALFFDADRISSLKDRANAKTSGLGILRSLVESGNLQAHTHVQIIFSRWDLFLEKQDLKEHQDFLSELKSEIIRRFGNTFNIDFFEVSARPINEKLEFGYGLDKLFRIWAKKSILDGNRIVRKVATGSENNQFLKF